MPRLLCLVVLAAAGPPAPAADPPPRPVPPGVYPVAAVPCPVPGLNQEMHRGDGVRQFAFLPDGKTLVGNGLQGRLDTYGPGPPPDANDPAAQMGNPFGPGVGGYGYRIAVAPHPTRPWVLAAEANQHGRPGTRVTLWDLTTRKQVRDLDEGAAVVGLSNPVFDPAGKTVWLWEWYFRHPNQPRQPGQPETVLRVWDADTGDELRAVPVPDSVPDFPEGGYESHVLAFAPSGRWAAVVHGRRVFLLEAATGALRADLGMLPGRLGAADPYQRQQGRPGADAVAVSGDGRQVLVGCRDGAVRRWDVVAGRELSPLVGHSDGVRAIWCSPDGKTARTLATDKILTWDLSAGGWRPPKDPPGAAELPALLDQLGQDEPATRYAAAETLAAHPKAAVEAIRAAVRPVPPLDPAKVAEIQKGLVGTEYNARKRALREVRRLGEPALAAFGDPNNPQVQFQGRYDHDFAHRLIKEVRDKARTADAARAVRAVEVLERLATPEAAKLLEELAAGAPLASLTVAAKEPAARLKDRPAATPPAAPADPAVLWADLGSDAAKAHRAAAALVARGDGAVPFLKDKLLTSPARPGLDRSRVPKLVEGLGAVDFAEREKAMRELAGYGTAAVPQLREAVVTAASPEVRRRLTELLRAPADPSLRPAAVQAARAVEVLEWVGTAAARAALEAAADGAGDGGFREAVAGAVGRLGKGP